jgi:hypothetical protein
MKVTEELDTLLKHIQPRGPWRPLALVQQLRELLPRVVMRLRELEAARQQLEVQLAGCGAAAKGWSQDDPAKPGHYGWSASYGDVLELRTEIERLRTRDRLGPTWHQLIEARREAYQHGFGEGRNKAIDEDQAYLDGYRLGLEHGRGGPRGLDDDDGWRPLGHIPSGNLRLPRATSNPTVT